MRRQARKGGGLQFDIDLSAMGARGDALGALPDGTPLFVPFALPGEAVRVRTAARSESGVRGDLLEVVTASAERVDPPCENFGPCGGCQLQHWAVSAQSAWKVDLVRSAVRRAGFDADLVRPLLQPDPSLRRRARFVSQAGKVGFRERRGKMIADITGCLTLVPELIAFAQTLRAPAEPLEWTVTATPAGLDVAATGTAKGGSEAPDPLALQNMLADLPKVARVSWNDDVLLEMDAPRIDLGGLAPSLPPGGFLQPSEGGQRALQQLVLDAIPAAADWVADLFCGVGTFAVPLAARGQRVQALESYEPAIAALDAAVRRDPTNKFRIHVGMRNLDLYPLREDELDGFEAVVFDPPRSGARAQARRLAASVVPVVVSVSCNPSTWARDAALLREGGYSLSYMQPVDQFPHTSHLEMVAVFTRDT